ncbi:hypothetical protein Tco_1545846 [Tanacetum coccineum]
MIINDSRIEDKKPSELILPPMDMLETFPYVRDVDYITRDLAVSSVRLRDVAVYYHFAISTFPVKIVIRSSAFISEFPVIEQVAARSGMDSKMAELIPHDREDHRACLKSSNHLVSDHLHVYI